MKRVLALVSLLVALCAPAVVRADAPDRAAAAERQVLVLLNLPPEHARADGSYGTAYAGGAGEAARRRIAARIARAHGLSLVTGWPMPTLGLDCFVMSVPSGQAPEDAAAALSKDPQVAWSEPMHLYRGRGAARTSAPNDPLFRAQPAARQWRLAELHRLATGRGVRVAVIDSQVDAAHPDLAGQVELRRDFVGGPPVASEAHGTGVAGVIAAVEDNGIGIAGVAPGARVLALRACWQAAAATECDSLSLARALNFAVERRAQVINLSLAGPPDRLLSRLVDAALAQGATVVGALDPDLPGGGFPAQHAGVVAVTDDPAQAGRAYLAPGRETPTTLPGGRFGLVSGSSYAAAHVSGLFALTRERNPRAAGAAALATAAAKAGGPIDAWTTVARAADACSACTPAARAALARR